MAEESPAGLILEQRGSLVFVAPDRSQVTLVPEVKNLWAASEDGSVIAYGLFPSRDGFQVLNTLTGELVTVAEPHNSESLVVAPDGSKVVFSDALAGGAPWLVYDVSTGTISNLGLPANQFELQLFVQDWSPDGSLLVAAVRESRNAQGDLGNFGIAVFGADGSGWRFYDLTDFLGGPTYDVRSVRFGPDSDVVYFTSYHRRDVVSVLDIATGEVSDLPAPPEPIGSAFTIERFDEERMLVQLKDGNDRIWVALDADGSQSDPVLNRPVDDIEMLGPNARLTTESVAS